MLIKKTIWTAVLAVAIGALAVSCGSKKGMTTATVVKPGKPSTSTSTTVKPGKTDIDTSALTGEALSLVKEAETWLGVPYRYGGKDREGVDCSGFVMQVYLNALDKPLPRSSSDMHDYCTNKIVRDSLAIGDLVFFDTSRSRDGKVSHVGLYVGEGNMIHSSTSKGVIVTSLDTDYYSGRFLCGGRVLAVKEPVALKAVKEPVEEAKPVVVVEEAKPVVVEEAKPVVVEEAKPVKAKPAKSEPDKPAKTEPAKPAKSEPAKPVSDRDKVINRLIEMKVDSIYGRY